MNLMLVALTVSINVPMAGQVKLATTPSAEPPCKSDVTLVAAPDGAYKLGDDTVEADQLHSLFVRERKQHSVSCIFLTGDKVSVGHVLNATVEADRLKSVIYYESEGKYYSAKVSK